MEPQDVLLDGGVVPTGGQQFDQFQEVGVLFGVEFFEDLFQSGLLQHADLGLVEHSEVRGEPQLFEVLADKVPAERVDGADLRGGEEHLLCLQMFVGRVLPQLFGDGFREAGAHLRGGGSREGDDEELIGGTDVFRIGQTADAAFDEDRRFAGTGRGADDESTAPGVDGFLLIRRPVHLLCH